MDRNRIEPAVIVLSLLVGLLSGTAFQAQSQAPAPASGARPSFEIASVKPNKSADGRVMIQLPPGGRYTATNVPLRMLIRNAYQLQDQQLVDAPAWVNTDRFDIVAKAEGNPEPGVPGGPPGPYQLMMQSLLEERFKLAVHRKTREMPIYALVLARSDGKLGPRLTSSTTDCQALMAAMRAPGGPPPSFPQTGRPPCGMRMGFGEAAGGGLSISQLATLLAPIVQRSVFDRTGLAGTYDIEFTWTPDQMPSGALPPGAPPLPPIDPNGPSIFTALEEQLGLKLEATRGPVEVLVVDHVEQPVPD